MNLPETSVIGLGGLGTALTKTLLAQDVVVKSVFNRTEKKARDLADDYDIEIRGAFPTALSQLGEITFVTVSDRSIKDIADRLSELDGQFEGRTFVHCSGNESADLLQSLRSEGGVVASFHPLQTFTAQSVPGDFQGIYFSMQGDARAFPLLKKIAAKLGAKTLTVTKEQKSHLHTAAVMASNYVTALLSGAVEIGTQGELSADQVKKAILPLVETSLKNTKTQSIGDALTGPIKRGDWETVKKHLDLLADQSELKNLYCLLGLQTVKLAESSGNLQGTAAEKIRKMLSEEFIL